MLIIDIILLIIILGFFIHGWHSGFIKTIGSLIGLLVGIVLASRYFELVAEWLVGFTNGRENLAKIIGFLIIFVAVNVVVAILVVFLTNLFKIIPLMGTLNRLSGAILSLILGVFLIGFLIIMIDKFPFSEFITQYFEDSEVVPWLVAVAKYLTPLLPQAIEQIKGAVEL
jgi:uncharacterized membrane protein required for colicin V production